MTTELAPAKTLLGRGIFPTPSATGTTDTEMLKLLQDSGVAIGYALEYLQPWELQEFLSDWWKKADMTPWLAEWRGRRGSA